MTKIVCRLNKNHMAQFTTLDGFVVFNHTRSLDEKYYSTYEITIRKLSTPNKKIHTLKRKNAKTKTRKTSSNI